MKFIALFNLKDNVDQVKLVKLAEVVARRIDYVPPVKTIAEYHSPRRAPCVVAIYETEDCERLIINSAAWIDAFEIDVFPVEDWTESIEKLGQFFAGE